MFRSHRRLEVMDIVHKFLNRDVEQDSADPSSFLLVARKVNLKGRNVHLAVKLMVVSATQASILPFKGTV